MKKIYLQTFDNIMKDRNGIEMEWKVEKYFYNNLLIISIICSQNYCFLKNNYK